MTRPTEAEVKPIAELLEIFAEYGQACGEYESARERLERDRAAADCREIKARFTAALESQAKRIAELEASLLRVRATLDDPAKFNTIDLRNELQPFLNEWLAKANRASQRHGFAESYRHDSNDRQLLDYILIAVFGRVTAALEGTQQ
jgi:uncharacterized protein YPO0396